MLFQKIDENFAFFSLFFNFEVLYGIKKCFLAKIEQKTSFLTKKNIYFLLKSAPKTKNE